MWTKAWQRNELGVPIAFVDGGGTRAWPSLAARVDQCTVCHLSCKCPRPMGLCLFLVCFLKFIYSLSFHFFHHPAECTSLCGTHNGRDVGNSRGCRNSPGSQAPIMCRWQFPCSDFTYSLLHRSNFIIGHNTRVSISIREH